MDRGIDTLLANFTRELDYFVLARDRLQPVMEPLLSALERVVTNAADGVALIEAHHMRVTYLEHLTEVRPLLEEWLHVRGTGERLREVASSLSPAQSQRLQSLLTRDATISPGRLTFETLQRTLHERLASFDNLST
jgi:hypothetical protein